MTQIAPPTPPLTYMARVSTSLHHKNLRHRQVYGGDGDGVPVGRRDK